MAPLGVCGEAGAQWWGVSLGVVMEPWLLLGESLVIPVLVVQEKPLPWMLKWSPS